MSLELANAGLMLAALGLYVILGGADFGAGVWDLFASGPRAKQQRTLLANAIAPIGHSRMTETILPPEKLARIRAEEVSPLVALLASGACPVTGETFEVGGGYVSRVAVVEARGAVFGPGFGPDEILERWKDVTDLSQAQAVESCMRSVEIAFEAIAKR